MGRFLLSFAGAEPPAQHDPDHDGRAQHGGHRADAQLGGGKYCPGQSIAEQAEGRPAQKTGRDHQYGPRSAKQPLCQVRDRNAHKGDGAGKGGHAGGQHAGQQDQRRPKGPDVHPHAPGAALPQLIGPHGLGQQEASNQRRPDDRQEHPQVGPGHPGKAAHGPVVQVDDVGVAGEGDHKLGDRGAEIPDHHPAYHQQGHLVQPLGQEQHKAHGQHGPCESGQDHPSGAHHHPPGEQAHHSQGDRQLGPGGDPQHKGAGDGVGKEGLEEKAGHRQGAPQQGGGQGPGQAELPDHGGVLPLPPDQDVPHLARRQGEAAGVQAPEKQTGQQQGQQQKGQAPAPGTGLLHGSSLLRQAVQIGQ